MEEIPGLRELSKLKTKEVDAPCTAFFSHTKIILYFKKEKLT